MMRNYLRVFIKIKEKCLYFFYFSFNSASIQICFQILITEKNILKMHFGEKVAPTELLYIHL